MHLTVKEQQVVDYLKKNLDDVQVFIAYSEIESDLGIASKSLRGVISSLIKKKVITFDYIDDAKMSFIGLRD